MNAKETTVRIDLTFYYLNMKYSFCTAFQSYEPHQYLNLIFNVDPRVTREPWWSYIAHLKNIAFGQDCSAKLKYITMTEVYVVLVLWNIIL